MTNEVLCKRDYHYSGSGVIIFSKDKYYTIKDDVKRGYWIIYLDIAPPHFFYKKGSVDLFTDYFYTRKEYRKLKLQQIWANIKKESHIVKIKYLMKIYYLQTILRF